MVKPPSASSIFYQQKHFDIAEMKRKEALRRGPVDILGGAIVLAGASAVFGPIVASTGTKLAATETAVELRTYAAAFTTRAFAVQAGARVAATATTAGLRIGARISAEAFATGALADKAGTRLATIISTVQYQIGTALSVESTLPAHKIAYKLFTFAYGYCSAFSTSDFTGLLNSV